MDTLSELQTIQHRVLDQELNQWKRGQQLSGNGVSFDDNLDEIQVRCEILTETIWTIRRQLKNLSQMCSQLPLGPTHEGSHDRQIRTLIERIDKLLNNLVFKTFIVEKQPPQVLKTQTRFEATIRLLVGGKLNVDMTPPQV